MFAQVGAKMGASTWLDYNSRFYVGKKIPFDLPVKVSTVTPANGQSLKLNQLAENSFGQGIDSITPLQMTMIDNAIANNGVLRSEEHTSELQSRSDLVCRLLLEKKNSH